jgi:selenocysteine lyase/cysteine desulfurase
VTFTKDGEDALAVRDRLAAHGINVTVSDVFSTRLDMEARRLDSVVRASVHYYNTDDEIDRFIAVLGEES